jgi:hypothetical protein
MDEISNKTLATLLVVAIVISLAGTFFAMRGVSQVTNVITGALPTATGTTKVYINQTVSITLRNNNVDFGAGYRNSSVVADAAECNLTSSAAQPSCWVNTGTYNPSDFWLENDGNVYANVTINSTVAANYFNTCGTTTIIAGDPDYTWAGKELASGGCGAAYGTLDTSEGQFTGAHQLLCTNLSADDSVDDFNVTIKLYVPTGPSGQCDNNVVFTAARSS